MDIINKVGQIGFEYSSLELQENINNKGFQLFKMIWCLDW